MNISLLKPASIEQPSFSRPTVVTPGPDWPLGRYYILRSRRSVSLLNSSRVYGIKGTEN
jgi:hypothetical protein